MEMIFLRNICVNQRLFAVQNFVYLVLVLTITNLLTACSTASLSFHNNATAKGLSLEYIEGLNYRHSIYANKATTQQDRKILHVYVGSDGTPWFEHRFITKDPTPLRPVLIDFVKRDKQPAIYLGRPCYHQLDKKAENCTEEVWTSGRYSRRVVESMAQALQGYIGKYRYKNIQLIGYSGGGSLVMLMTPHIKQVRSVITLAGNLDTDAWIRHHHYVPLTDSLNPSTQPALHPGIRQIHFVGDKDRNIPVSMLSHALKSQNQPELVVLTNVDHSCCWLTHFEKILNSPSPKAEFVKGKQLVEQNNEEG